jgi:hypothetical protein
VRKSARRERAGERERGGERERERLAGKDYARSKIPGY